MTRPFIPPSLEKETGKRSENPPDYNKNNEQNGLDGPKHSKSPITNLKTPTETNSNVINQKSDIPKIKDQKSNSNHEKKNDSSRLAYSQNYLVAALIIVALAIAAYFVIRRVSKRK